MKPAGQPVFQDIALDAAGAIGPIAGLEARLDRCDELGVMVLAGAGRTVQPGMEARSRHVQHVAQPADEPDVAVFGDEGEPQVASRAKKAAAFFRMSRFARSRAFARLLGPLAQPRSVFLQGRNLGRSAGICPFPGNAVAGVAASGRSSNQCQSGPPPRIQRRGTLSATSRSRAA